ncbi:MAG: hypothetical protein HQ552_04730 [Desulfobacteraceae bacterium]|nr:hypothetical protein [Desulfobacteraceae bacterium]
MGTCNYCNTSGRTISNTIGYCADCIRDHFDVVWPQIKKVHDQSIPYSLLAFYPQFYLNDLPTTAKSHALRCREVALDAGLANVNIGNIHLLSKDYS